MGNSQPTYKKLVSSFEPNGINQRDLHATIYNLWQAVIGLCRKAEETNACGSQWMAMIGSSLNAVFESNIATPVGPTKTGPTPTG